MSKKMIIDEVLLNAPNRRRLLKTLGIASAAATWLATQPSFLPTLQCQRLKMLCSSP
jgi:hypothetical protein